mmetsp:Transcript_55573/g.81189  ORF Transcript_55573/g.81189 Transcript_55573/m.81189 type:complete len:90 (+) Transcript_55573:100-369(+)
MLVLLVRDRQQKRGHRQGQQQQQGEQKKKQVSWVSDESYSVQSFQQKSGAKTTKVIKIDVHCFLVLSMMIYLLYIIFGSNNSSRHHVGL